LKDNNLELIQVNRVIRHLNSNTKHKPTPTNPVGANLSNQKHTVITSSNLKKIN